MTKFLENHGNAAIISTASSPILGMDDCVISRNKDQQLDIDNAKKLGYEEANKHTHQKFLPEKVASPHPRFLGLAQSIYERRQEKVNN